jgi:hypothetical protein
MRSLLHALVLSSFGLFACSHAEPAPPAPATAARPEGKPAAPVTITTELAEGQAHVTVRFDAPAKGVQVGVHGVDGLALDGPTTLVSDGAYAQGDSTSFVVRFAPPTARASLAVSVQGDFHGVKQARVASFLVKDGPLPRGPGQVITTDDGQRVKVLPAAQP